MSTAHLLGMLTGVGVISLSHEPLYLFGAFSILTPINIWATIKMLNAAEFEVLNQAKLTLLSRTFIDSGKAEGYKELRSREIGFGEWIKPGSHVSIRLKLGASAEQTYDSVAEVQSATHVMKVSDAFFFYSNMCALSSFLFRMKIISWAIAKASWVSYSTRISNQKTSFSQFFML